MLKKQRAKLARISATVAVTYGFAIYSIHNSINEAQTFVQNTYGTNTASKTEVLDAFAEMSFVFDLRVHYSILAIAVLIFIYQSYRYFTTVDTEEDLRREEQKTKRQQEIVKERVKWNGVGSVSEVPKGLLVILGMMILLAVLYWVTI